MEEAITTGCKAIFTDPHEHRLAKDQGITIKQRILTINTLPKIIASYTRLKEAWIMQTTYNAINYCQTLIQTLMAVDHWELLYDNSTATELYHFIIHHMIHIVQKHIVTI